MKRRILIILLCLIFILNFSFVMSAHADVMTVSQIASIAYAISNSWGFDFGMTNMDVSGVNDYLSNEINSFLGGQTIIEKFGADQARIVAGKLIVPHLLYNGIKEFFESFKQEKHFVTGQTGLTVTNNGYTAVCSGFWRNDTHNGATFSVFNSATGEVNTVNSTGRLNSETKSCRCSKFDVFDRQMSAFVTWTRNDDQERTDIKPLFPASGQSSYVNLTLSGDIPETVLYPDQAWSGTIGGEDWPDTNLDQLLGAVDQMVLDGDLTVDGEIVEPGPAPTPVPTPVPVDPQTPLQDVPWEGLNDLLNQTFESMEDKIDEQTQSVTEAQEATTEAVETLTDTIESALDVPSEQELPDFKFDLRELFPFCIPFDIYRLLTAFDANPVAPHVQIPFVIESLNFTYNIDLDFSVFDPVAQVLRTVEFIVYALGLAWATGKVIKW